MNSAVWKQFKARPSLFGLVGSVSATIGMAIAYGTFKVGHDQQLVFNSKDDPYPYLRAAHSYSPSFSHVSQREENLAEDHYDLLDILNGKYRG